MTERSIGKIVPLEKQHVENQDCGTTGRRFAPAERMIFIMFFNAFSPKTQANGGALFQMFKRAQMNLLCQFVTPSSAIAITASWRIEVLDLVRF